MSNYVDERIVEMKFDNQNFEKNVQVSLKTLDELNKKLKLEDAGKSFENIQNASSKIDLSNLANNVQAVADRCSFLGIVGDEVIRRLTNGFMDLNQAVITTVKSLTIDQIGVGFDKYERKVQSVQTIMNATGKSIDEVSVALDKLNWFTDETSYSYADMVDNISKFTSSNVDLDTAVTSMIGIADAAGLAGANVQDASHAMEGFSKAIAQGYMSRQNWQWIRTAHMDTTKFKDVLIQAAVAEGTLTKAMDGTYQTVEGTTVSIADFETALKDGWMTTKVINSALNEFGGTTEKIYAEYQKFAGDKTTSEIIDSMGASIDDLGLKSFRAAQEAKTFSDAINSVKDAVSTGWMVSFEQIFGDYEEARHFWTDVANEMWDIFASGGESRNELFTDVFSGAFKDFRSELSSMGITIDKFEKSLRGVASNAGLNVDELVEKYESISGALRAGAISGDMAKEALRGLADEMTVTSTETVDLNAKLTEIKGKVNEVIQGVYGNGETRRQALEELGYSYEYIQSLVNQILLEGREITLDDVKIFEQEIQTMTGLTEEQRQALLAFIDGNEEANASFDELIVNMQKKTGQELVHGMILNLLGGIKDVQEAFRAASEDIFGGTEQRASFLYSVLENLHDLTERFRLTEESSENLRKTISGVLSILRFFIVTGEKLITILSPIKNLFNLSGDSILEFSGNIGEAITNFVKWYEESEEVSATTEKLRGYVERFIEVLRRVISFIRNLAEKFLPLIRSGLSSIKKYISNSPIPGFLNRIKNRIRDLWRYIEKIDFGSINIDLSGFSSFISAAADAILALYNAIKDYLTPYIDKARVALSNFDVVLDPIRKKIEDFKTEVEESGGILGYLGKKISEVKTKVSDFINNGGLGKLFDGFTESFGPVKEKLDKFLEDVGKELENIDWGSVLAFSIGFSLVPAVLSISAAFTEAAKLFKTGKGVLGTINGILTKFKNGFKTTVQQISEAALAFSVAIAVLAGAIWVLSKVPAYKLKTTAAILAGVMAAFAGMVTIIAAAIKLLKVDPKAMLGILAFAGAVGILAVSLKVLEDIYIDKTMLATLALLMLALSGIAIALSKLKVNFEGVGLYFLTFAAAILLLAVALEKIGEIPTDSLTGSVEAITLLMATLAIVTTASKLVGGSALGILALVGAVYLLIKLLEKLGDDKIKELVAKASENWLIITGVLTAVFGMGFLLGKLNDGKNAARIGVGVALMAASLLIVLKAIELFAKVKTEDLVKGEVAVIFVLGMFAIIAKAMSGAEKVDGAKIGVGIAIMSASLLIVYYAVKQFAKLNVRDLEKGMQSIVVIFALYAALIASTALTKDAKTGPIVAMTVALITITASLAALSFIDWKKLLPGVLSLIAILITLSASLATIAKKTFDVGQIIAMVVAIGGVAAALYVLADKDWASLLAGAVGISAVLEILSHVLAKISDIKFDNGDTFWQSIGALLAGVLAVYIIGKALAAVAAFPWEQSLSAAGSISMVLGVLAGVLALSDHFSLKGAGILILAVAGIAAVVLALVWLGEQIAEKAINYIISVSDKLPDLADNITTLFDALSNLPEVDPNIGEIFKNIGLGFAALAAAEFVDNLNAIFGNDAFSGLGDKMQTFGDSMTTLSKSLPSKEELDKIVIAMDALYNIAYVIQDFPKNTDWKKLNNNLSNFGAAIYGYGEEVYGTKYAAISESVDGVKNVVAIAELLPTTGGFIGLFTGKTDWEGISDNLWDFGYALKHYSQQVASSDFNPEAIAKSVPAAKNVAEIADTIPTTGRFIGLFSSAISWETIQTNLNLFGSAITRYGITVADLSPDSIASSVGAVKNLVSAIDEVYYSKSFSSLSDGSVDMKNFKAQVIAYGEGIRDFSKIAADIDFDSLSAASDLQIIGENFGISITKGISASESDVIKAIGKLINSAYDTANRKSSSFYPVGSEIATSIAAGISSNLKTIETAMSEYSNSITKEIGILMLQIPPAIQNGGTGITNAVTVIITTCISRIRGSYREFVSAATYLANGFASGFQINSIAYSMDDTIMACAYRIRNHYYDFYNAGRFIVQGVADGIRGNTYIATNAISYMSNRMENKFLAMNEINSPARLYSKWAKYIPMGVAEGITNNAGLAEDAVADMGQEMFAAISPALVILSRLVDEGFEISPQIRPVVDLEDVYASAKRIDQLFAENSTDANISAGRISRNVGEITNSRANTSSGDSQVNSRNSSPVFNTYIYTQPGQSTEDIANEVERRMVRNLNQRRTAFSR